MSGWHSFPPVVQEYFDRLFHINSVENDASFAVNTETKAYLRAYAQELRKQLAERYPEDTQ